MINYVWLISSNYKFIMFFVHLNHYIHVLGNYFFIFMSNKFNLKVDMFC